MEKQIADILYDYANSLFQHRGYCRSGWESDVPVKLIKIKGRTLAEAIRDWMKMIDYAGWSALMDTREGIGPIDFDRERLQYHDLGIIWRRYPEVSRLEKDGYWLITSRQIITNNPAVRGYDMEA